LIHAGLCSVLAAALIGAITSGGANAETPERAAITVTPSEDLVSGQQVQVDGSGFPAGHNIRVGECKGRGDEPPKGKPQRGCILLGTTTADADGRFGLAVTVQKSFVWEQYPWDPETLTCEGDCTIEANNYFYTDNEPPRRAVSADHPITFAS
jgi:hypothetical protein